MHDGFIGSKPLQPGSRLAALDSIRGLACLQVLLLHSLSAFAPAFVFRRPSADLPGLVHFSPLFLAYDGYSAVYVFFVLSGFVLTPLFARCCDRPSAAIASRLARLFAPACAAALIALAIKIEVGDAPARAGRVAGSGWLAHVWSSPSGPMYFLYDALVQGPLTGYAQTSILANLGLPIAFHSVEDAYVAPFWTLSVEAQGSILILGLVLIRRRSRAFWRASVCLFGVLLFRGDFLCFVIGHLLAQSDLRRRLETAPRAALIGLASLGMALCVIEELPFVAVLAAWRAHGPAWIPCGPHSLKMAGAILMFAAALGSSTSAEISGVAAARRARPPVVSALSHPLADRRRRLLRRLSRGREGRSRLCRERMRNRDGDRLEPGVRAPVFRRGCLGDLGFASHSGP